MTVSRVPNVEGGIQPTIVTAKGDLITAVANANPARLGVGSDGQLLTADSTTATGLSYQSNFAAGKNKIINGDFEVWQRGTSFTVAAGAVTYTADRFLANRNGSGTVTVSRQTFTPGTAPVSGYEGEYFFRFNQSVAGTGASFSNFSTRVEDVRTFAGQTATLSFWAKADSSRSIPVGIGQNFGSGGSGGVYPATTSVSMTTSWQRFTVTVSVPSVSGKTIGAGSYVDVYWEMPLNATFTIDIWGVQLEAGSTATAFQTATGTIQGELAACQRYYVRWSDDTGLAISNGSIYNSTSCYSVLQFPFQMRTAPAVSASATNAYIVYANNTSYTSTGNTFAEINTKSVRWLISISGATQGHGAWLQFNGSGKFIEASAEL